jgi:hypothetical protein
MQSNMAVRDFHSWTSQLIAQGDGFDIWTILVVATVIIAAIVALILGIAFLTYGKLWIQAFSHGRSGWSEHPPSTWHYDSKT